MQREPEQRERQKLSNPSQVSRNNCLLFLALRLPHRRRIDFPKLLPPTNCSFRCVRENQQRKIHEWGQSCAVLAWKGFFSHRDSRKAEEDNEKIIVLGWKSGFFHTRSRICLKSDVSALRNECLWLRTWSSPSSVYKLNLHARAKKKKIPLRDGNKWAAKRSKGRRDASEGKANEVQVSSWFFSFDAVA